MAWTEPNEPKALAVEITVRLAPTLLVLPERVESCAPHGAIG